MDQSRLRDFEGRCIQEEAPACQTMCPLHVEARAFCARMAAGALSEARKILDRAMPLSAIVARLCRGPCLAHCRRAELDGAVNMPLLELACVQQTSSVRPMAMPATGKTVAVAGAGLSSLSLAFELAKKGHGVTVFHKGPPGGRLIALAPEILPQKVLDEALEQLAALRVRFEELPDFSPAWRDAVLEKHQALYAGLDDPQLNFADLDLGGISDYLTLETARDPRLFAGGQRGGSPSFAPSGPSPEASFVHEAADGKRAAGSIVRLLQGVAPSSARDREDVYPSALFTDISGAPSLSPVQAADPAAPTPAEALAEAGRCLDCQCLECVKRCVYLAEYKAYPKRYAREIYNNLAVVHGQRRVNRQINSCAECGLCAAVCPNKADMGAFCAEARKEMTATRRMPPSAHEFALEDMLFSNDPDLAFFRHQPGKSASAWAFFPGCQLPASMPEQTRELYEYLCAALPGRSAGAAVPHADDGALVSGGTYGAVAPGQDDGAAAPALPDGESLPDRDGGVGLLLRCCGAPARWSGRPALTRSAASDLRAVWEAAGRPVLLVACASCMAFFSAELPDLPVLSVWDALADLPLPQKALPALQTLALHDPCAARNTASTRKSVRRLLEKLAQNAQELPLGRELTRCCGYGGLADAANPALGRAMAQSRAGDSPLPMLSWCAMCRDRLRATGKKSLHLLDLLFPTGDAQAAALRAAPGISLRQEQRLLFSRNLLQELWQESPPPDSAMDAIILHIEDETARKLEARRILHSDIKKVLLNAGEQGPHFVNRETGRSLACLRPKQVTFWVEYAQRPDGSYDIHDAYCHRMVVPGTPGQGLPSAATLEGYAEKGGRM